jgi:hypothetical protein
MIKTSQFDHTNSELTLGRRIEIEREEKIEQGKPLIGVSNQEHNIPSSFQ